MPVCSYVEAAVTDLSTLAVRIRDERVRADVLPSMDPWGLRGRQLEAVRCELAAANRHLLVVQGRLGHIGPVLLAAVGSQLELLQGDDDGGAQ